MTEKGEEPLDAELWGRLQDHIPLDMVCEKLPFEDRFQLRVVCKSWHQIALQRLEPKPYFPNIAARYSGKPTVLYLNGLVKYDVASGELSFERLPYCLYRPFYLRYGFNRGLYSEVEGLMLCQHPDMSAVDEHLAVFNIHTKTLHTVPPPPDFRKEFDRYEMVGVDRLMMVDTSERPYTFKLVLGRVHCKTHIYDSKSRSWSTA